MNEESEKLSPGAELRAASYHRDMPRIRRLLMEGVDMNVADKWGRTALSLAAEQGHIDVVTALIRGGAWIDPHEDYDTKETPLVAAASNGHLAIVRVLIEAGANPLLHVAVSQATAEFYARQNGHTEVSRYLSQVMGI